MNSRSRCKDGNCDRCVTGIHKRPARRKERHDAKTQIRRGNRDEPSATI